MAQSVVMITVSPSLIFLRQDGMTPSPALRHALCVRACTCWKEDPSRRQRRKRSAIKWTPGDGSGSTTV
ncbi:Hypothetical predicted protein [Pelobates cultripes]|uniref:Uncharacterized protein n=1 Tax=Pelobates cultripes TaxID=61616 RepID=A0AAD1T8I8_PELCU|nr:Hypothetical predicted protein [Pelobates cultripes]